MYYQTVTEATTVDGDHYELLHFDKNLKRFSNFVDTVDRKIDLAWLDFKSLF